MTYKVTIWDEHKTIGMVRDYRLPVWKCGAPKYQCHGVASLLIGGKRVRPWHIEFEGEVPEGILYQWAPMCLHPKADSNTVISVNSVLLKNVAKETSIEEDMLFMLNQSKAPDDIRDKEKISRLCRKYGAAPF